MTDRRASPSAEPGYGRCGYPIRGLASPICPECGANRNVVGVRRPRGPWPASTRLAVYFVAWTVTFVGATGLAWPRLLTWTPRELSNHRDYRLVPLSGQYPPLKLRRIGYGWGWAGWQGQAVGPTRSVLSVAPQPNSWVTGEVVSELSYRMRTGDASYAATRFDRTGLSSVQPPWAGKLDEPALRRWLTVVSMDGKADAEAADVRAEAAELLSLMQSPTFVGGGPEAVPPRNAARTLGAASAIVWFAGLLIAQRFAGRRRRTSVFSPVGSAQR